MTEQPFSTLIDATTTALSGPWRSPRQMLAAQSYDAHASIHDDATAQKLGFKGGTIEGPTHFSQFAPLGVALFGAGFLSGGCISAHYRNPVFEGEEVQAWAGEPDEDQAAIWMTKHDGTEVLRGTISVGERAPPSALTLRLGELKPLEDAVILRDVRVGMRTGPQTVTMAPDQNMGALYPFSLTEKLQVITEPSAWYSGAANGSPWGKAIIPLEMISVLLQSSSHGNRFPSKGPAVGLFADQEIRLIDGPLFAGDSYEVSREVVALSGSRRTESMWVKSEVRRPGEPRVIATMLLNHAILKDSYSAYDSDRAVLYPS